MKNLNIILLLIAVAVTSLISTPSYSHVIPEDQLRNVVYMTTRQALQKVFAGVNKIKKENRKLTVSQQREAEKILQKKIKDLRIQFFTAHKDGRQLYATIGKTFANSHPVTKARFVVLLDSQGNLEECHIMEYQGPQRAEIISRDFLDQYRNKSAKSDFSIVASNQGPTPSVQALNEAVRKILVLYKVLYLDSSH